MSHTIADIERKEAEWAPRLQSLHTTRERLRKDPGADRDSLARVEKAYDALALEYKALRDPDAASRVEQVRKGDEPTGAFAEIRQRAQELCKADASLSEAEAVEQAATEPRHLAAYLREQGRESEAREVLAKAEKPTDVFTAAQQLADELRKADSSLSEVAAMEKAMADPEIRAAYEREMGRPA